jgi:hypothetical protein
VDEPLSLNEIGTLRRIANGGGYTSLLSEEALARLLGLGLVFCSAEKAYLTKLGRQRIFTAGGL